MSIKIKLFIFLFLSCFLHAENPDSTKAKIAVNKFLILEASKNFNIDPSYLAAIIYVERTSNYDWKDKALDALIAKRGYNSSVGFCQVKIKTAYWIETQLNDSSSIFCAGEKYVGLLKLSASAKELLKKLQDDSLNIIYAAAYLKIIQTYWQKSGFSIDNKPAIIGTLYSIGMFSDDGKARKPHAHPKANWFGAKVKASLFLFDNLFSSG
jgi:hypothetical protein